MVKFRCKGYNCGAVVGQADKHAHMINHHPNFFLLATSEEAIKLGGSGKIDFCFTRIRKS